MYVKKSLSRNRKGIEVWDKQARAKHRHVQRDRKHQLLLSFRKKLVRVVLNKFIGK